MGHVNHDTAAHLEAYQRKALVINRCEDCNTWIHPPKRVCPTCWSGAVASTEVGGSGRLVSYSRPRARPGLPPPVACGLVDLDEADGVRLLLRAGRVPDELRLGMSVEVGWEADGESFLPVFNAGGAA